MSIPKGSDQQRIEDIKGNHNQVIASVYGGNVINTVQGDVIQQAAKRITSPFQLPLNIDDFAGRTAELGDIAAALESAGRSDSVVILAVSGMAGVGKSALAICAAHRAIEQFPDAQLYVNLQGVNLQGMNAQPRDPSDVLSEWLRALGLDGSEIPPTLPERIKCYRSQLAGKRALVLLDNAHNEDQVRPLLPGTSGCAVIITSRHSLSALAGMREIALRTLLPEDALALLAKLRSR
ncbi:MAG: NB-ARC domain-containing protein [Phormidesmis sp.]